jgi:hypothetical protein
MPPFRLSAPEPLERDIHEQCAAALDAMLLPPSFWFSYPAGASILSPQQAARHIRIGLKRGLPDLWVLYRGVWLIELKRRGGRLSETRTVRTKTGAPRILAGQTEIFPKLCETGAVRGIAVCHSVDEVLDQIEQWEIPCRRRVRQC